MIILNIKANNIYCFNNFEIDLSYEKKDRKSLIAYEYLENYQNFKFKKLNILMGSNASGKTMFGYLLLNILSFLEKGQNRIITGIHSKESSFSIDFVLKKEKYVLFRVECNIEDYFVKTLKIQSTNIRKKDSYLAAKENLKTIHCLNGNKDYFLTPEMMKVLEDINLNSNVLFHFKDEIISENKIMTYDIKVLNTVLKTFDSNIKEVTQLKDTINGYIIEMNNGEKFLIQNRNISGNDFLSSGTKDGLNIAYIISEIKRNPNRLFYIDEAFSNVHPYIEQIVLSLMVGLLGKEAQLFFTTHNLDILEMNIPYHSFTFFSKKSGETNVIHPEKELLMHNNKSLRNKVENDLFGTIPNVNGLFQLK